MPNGMAEFVLRFAVVRASFTRTLDTSRRERFSARARKTTPGAGVLPIMATGCLPSFLAGFSRIWPDKIYFSWHESWQVVESSGQVKFEPRHLGYHEVNGVERAGKWARWRRLALCCGMTGFHHGTKGALCRFNMSLC